MANGEKFRVRAIDHGQVQRETMTFDEMEAEHLFLDWGKEFGLMVIELCRKEPGQRFVIVKVTELPALPKTGR